MQKSIFKDRKFFMAASITALAFLIVCFVVFDRYALAAAKGPLSKWMVIIYFVLMIYYFFSIARSIVCLRKASQKLFYFMSILVSILALPTFLIDKIMLNEIGRLYEEGFGYSGQQRMLLVSTTIKFIALLVSAMAAKRGN